MVGVFVNVGAGVLVGGAVGANVAVAVDVNEDNTIVEVFDMSSVGLSVGMGEQLDNNQVINKVDTRDNLRLFWGFTWRNIPHS